MIRRIEALNYRCLKYVSQDLGGFHVLVGPNAAGKTTFLDVVAFLGRLISDGVELAVRERTQNFHDLVWGRTGSHFELAIEAGIPEEFQTPAESPVYDVIRYEVAVGLSATTRELGILDEQVCLMESGRMDRESGPGLDVAPGMILKSRECRRGCYLILTASRGGLHVAPEERVDMHGHPTEGDYLCFVPLDSQRSILNRLPADHFPATTWLGEALSRGIHRLEASNKKLRRPCPPGKGGFLTEDGSNLPWVVAELQDKSPGRFSEWLAHVQTALPDLEGIRAVERPEDKHRYVMLRYRGGLEVPSWMLSDGTLRLLLFTLIPYLDRPAATCLVEEPENSLHPLNIETVMQSLQSVYDGQVLVATHSPVVLGIVGLEPVLVFSREQDTGTRIVQGKAHPGLANWHGEVSLGTLFAGGVLG